MAKKFPIKVFKKRENEDERFVEGMSGEDPKWVLSGSELVKKSQYLHSSLLEIKPLLDKKNETDDILPTVVKTTIQEDSIAKSYRKKINQVFNVNKKKNVIGFEEASTILIKIDDLNDFQSISEQLSNPEKNSYSISAIEEIEPFTPNISYSPDEPVKIKLLDYLDKDINELAHIFFQEICKTNDIPISRKEYTDNLVIYSVDSIIGEKKMLVESFSGLASISSMPYIVILDNETGEEIKMDIKHPQEEEDYPTVGILDSGISEIPVLQPWIEGKDTNYVEDDIDQSHGTFVAGILLYGDQLEQREFTGCNGVKLFDATVFPKGIKIREDELISNIVDMIKKYPAIHLWQLSLGGDGETHENKVSDFGSVLDDLQNKYEILIIKSAGNCSNFKNGDAPGRLKKGSDSALSVVVGSLAHNKGEYDLVEEDYPSPFSVSGPMLSNIVKPDLTHYGGNVGEPEKNRFVENGVNSFGTDGKTHRAVGTSFSTPRVTSIAAELYKRLEYDFNPLLIKALLIHSAKYPDSLDMEQNEKLNMLGFGVPSKANDILFNDDNEVTLILQDTISKGNYIEILDFPFPEELQIDDHYYGEIYVTLVSKPILDPLQGAEYCQSNIEISLGTYEQLKDRGTGKTIRNQIGRENSLNLLIDSHYSSKKTKHNIEFSKERILINYGKKYQPVKKWAINLEELKNTRYDTYLNSSFKWYLQIKAYYRDFAETMKPDDLNQNFCLIITIVDNNRNHKIFQSVEGLLNSRNFINEDIRTKSRIEISQKG